MQGNTGNFAKLIKSKLNYLGAVDLTQYFVKSFTIHDEEDLLKASTNGNKGVQVDFIFSRRLLNQVLTVFLPTIAIVIVSFCTSLFKVRAHKFSSVGEHLCRRNLRCRIFISDA